jgi:1-acyl-sn-glycerol-3-phosphate acyltransferase
MRFHTLYSAFDTIPTNSMSVNDHFFFALAASLFAILIAFWRARTCAAGWRAWLCYQILRFHRLFFSRVRQNNACTIPEHGPAIIVSNHTSPVDPTLVWYRHYSEFRQPRLRVIGFMMAKEYYGLPVIGWICRAMESIPIARAGRDMGPVREALRRLENGHLLGLFPEGGINIEAPDSQLRKAGTGIAWLSLKSRAPVIPVFIHNAPRSKSMVLSFLVRAKSRLTYGPAIDLSRWNSAHNEKQSQATLCEVTDHIMKTLADLGGIRFTPSGSSKPMD